MMGAPLSHPVVVDPAQTFIDIVTPALRDEIGADPFGAWFGTLRLERLNGATAHLTVRTKFLRAWLQEHYTVVLKSAIASAFPDITKISIEVSTRAIARAVAPAPTVRADCGPASPILRHEVCSPRPSADIAAPRSSASISDLHLALEGSRLDPRLSFKTFHVGASNRLAHVAAMKVAEATFDDEPVFNPLYVHGAVGLGKSHLLQAIGNAVADDARPGRRRRTIYMSAERFMYSFVLALKTQSSLFRDRLRDIDVFIIDDAQFLQGRAVQQAFCDTVTALLDARKQVVVAADRPPADLEHVDDRVKSRLSGGLTVEVGAFDYPLRVKLLKSLVDQAVAVMPSFSAGVDVVSYVASAVQTNGRDLAGATNRLMAYASIHQEPLTVATATAAIQDLVRERQVKRVKIEEIQKIVAAHFNVSRTDILSSRRTANVVRPRQIAMYLSKILTLRSLPEIGRRFGGRDHTTVLHAIRKIEKLQGADNEIVLDLNVLRGMIEGAP